MNNKRNTCQTTGKNKTGGRGRDEKDKTIGRDEKCPLAKRPAKVLLFEHICNRKSGLQIQYVGHERKAKCPTFFMPNFFGIHQVEVLCIIFGGALGYSWGFHGEFVEYSRNIHMYRVCVGYVSGMYRESVEGDGAQGGGDGCRMQIDESIFFCKYCSLCLRMCIF